ncbi:MAG: FAD:protein FMN transferase [Proteobacteria bacterium]|nr:FAD:protein FMN transferase [Pseudomonadota bacterium]
MKLLTLMCLLCATGPVLGEWAVEEATIMGTTVHVEVWHPNTQIRQQGINKALEIMDHVNRLMSPYIEESQLSKINQFAHERPVSISTELFEVIRKSVDVAVLTKGAFDITYASVGHLYDYPKQTRPSDDKISQAKVLIDYKNMVLDKERQSVSFLRPGMKIDLGGIAKGYAVDRAVQALTDLGIRHAQVAAGGDMRMLGGRLDRPWRIGIRDPRKPGDIAVTLFLKDQALSTSGDYERSFSNGGTLYHHILDPGTGDSAREVSSVSILGPDAITTDSLSTSVFVLGIEKGLQLINGLESVEGIIIDRKGKFHYSEHFKEYR